MRRAIRISGVALRGLVVATALGAAAFLLLPRLLGWQVVTVMSGSMAPTYPVDAVLALDPVDPAKVREGDVIAFETESDRPMVTHRVVAITHDAGGLAFVTKGDANEEADIDPVAASAVRGRVVVGIPYLGSFVRVVHNPVGFAIFLVLPGVVLIGQEILSMRRDRRDRRAKKDLKAVEPAAPTVAAVAGPEGFDFWTTDTTEELYFEELEREVREWSRCAS